MSDPIPDPATQQHLPPMIHGLWMLLLLLFKEVRSFLWRAIRLKFKEEVEDGFLKV